MTKRVNKLIIIAFSLIILFSAFSFAQEVKVDSLNDLVCGCSGDKPRKTLVTKSGFIDIVNASVFVEDNSSKLVLKLTTDKPIPTRSKYLVSYSFLVDLDGDKSTGFAGNRSPLGVFPDLGIDLWANYSLYDGNRADFGLIGSPDIPNLKVKPNLTRLKKENGNHDLVFEVSIPRVEQILSYAYLKLSPPWQVKPNDMKWIVFSYWAPLSSGDPISDFCPEKFYSPSGGSCFANPLVRKVKEELEKKERKMEGTPTRDTRDGGKKVPPPPPPPPTPPE